MSAGSDWIRETDSRDYESRRRVCFGTGGGTKESDLDAILVEVYRTDTGNEIHVARDDELCGGTKSRIVLDYLRSLPDRYEEYAYVTSAFGGAQIALAWGVERLNEEKGRGGRNKRAVLFTDITPPGTLEHAYIRIGKELGAKYVVSASPYSDAAKYVRENPSERILLPSGFKSEENIERIADYAARVREEYGKFDEVWAAVGSGTLINGLQRGGLAKKYYGLCVFQSCPYVGNAVPIYPDKSFVVPVDREDLPPYPSASRYDAKLWEHARKRSGKILVWNVL